jgi:phospholipid/cholesterol/gamma-HCH transport system substrate-binding protein
MGAFGIVANLKLAAAFLGVVAVALFSFRGLVPLQSYDLWVPLDNAGGLGPGSEVLIAGARAGGVQNIKLDGNKVLVQLSIDPAHAPVLSDGEVTVRPKSLLGEKYLDLNPGRRGDALKAGSRLPANRTAISTDLQEVINAFDEPTRAKLQTILIELGGGTAGRGPQLNETFRYGTQDLNDLRDIANTIRARDAELQKVIVALDGVTSELARSERRQQLGELIKNTDVLMKTLADQDSELKRALAQTNAALGRTDAALSGTEGNLAGLIHSAPVLVHRTNLLMGDLARDSDVVLSVMPVSLQAIPETTVIFGGKDANGYATRISVLVGKSSSALPAGSTAGVSDRDLYAFLLGVSPS